MQDTTILTDKQLESNRPDIDTTLVHKSRYKLILIDLVLPWDMKIGTENELISYTKIEIGIKQVCVFPEFIQHLQ